MALAARLPAPAARITVAAPVTASPPANTSDFEVSPVWASATRQPFLFVARPAVVRVSSGFGVVPIASTTFSTGNTNSLPSIGIGRARPIPIEGSEFVLPVENVVLAIGTTPNPLLTRTTAGLATNKKGCLVADAQTGLTSKSLVFAGGDAVTGAATVILAAGAGKRAAKAIHETLDSARN